MSAAPSLNVVDLGERRAKRSASAGPVHKLRVLEATRALVQAGELRRSAIAVVQYLGEVTDKESGLARVRLNTIADATTYSRGEVCKAITELKAAGLVERIAHVRGKERQASSFRLCDLDAVQRRGRRLEASRSTPGGVISRARSDEDSSPSGLDPLGASAAKPAMPVARQKDHARQGGARDCPAGPVGNQPSPGDIPAETEQAIRNKLGDGAYDTWIRPCHLVRDDGATVILGAPSDHIRDYVAGHYTEPIAQATGRKVEVVKRPRAAG